MGAALRCRVQASHCGGFSCCGAQALGRGLQWLWAPDSRAQVQLLCDLWDLPRPGIKRVSSALAGAFFTSEPPGKPVNAS